MRSVMFEWLFGNKYKKLERKTQEGFSSVKGDMDVAGKWIKHLDMQDKRLFDALNGLRLDLSSIREEVEGMQERISLVGGIEKNKRVFEKTPDLNKQTGVLGVGNAVQTAVQTANFYGILKNLTGNERLVIFTLLNSDMKLSYEDLALLLGKERSTVRGQINAIKQKSGGLITEILEKNGKKRVFIPLDVKEKLSKYAKVRVGKRKKVRINEENVMEGKNLSESEE